VVDCHRRKKEKVGNDAILFSGAEQNESKGSLALTIMLSSRKQRWGKGGGSKGKAALHSEKLGGEESY